MSILIIGDDHNDEIRKLCHSCGVYRSECWKSCECLNEFPKNIDGIILLPDEYNRCLIGEYKLKATYQGIPYVCVQNVKRAKSAFAKLSNEWHEQWLENIMK